LFIGHLLITVPYVLRLTLTSLRGMDPQLERASQSLGATSWQTTRYVVLPNIAPGLLAGVVFSFLISFDEVTISLFTGLPGNTTLPTEIFHIASQGSDPIVTAVSGIMILLSAALVLLAEKTVGVLKMIANET
jgi:putative spermidine/putrescine transport system permease protein